MGYFIFDNTTNSLDLDEIHHIKDVLRLKPGANIKATDGKGNLYNLRIANLKPFNLEIINIENIANNNIYIRCVIATIKVPLLELIIQKLTEIGVDEIIVTKTKFAQIGLDKLENKLQRWQTIINTACKQAERVHFPTMSIQNIDEIEYAANNSLNLIGDTQFSDNPQDIKSINLNNITNITLLIGPEGGFEKQEYTNLVEKYNYVPVTFTPYILRSETAAIVGTGILKNLVL
jgi:16S rRNA (uracil1498-N3)-methyltransferase